MTFVSCFGHECTSADESVTPYPSTESTSAILVNLGHNTLRDDQILIERHAKMAVGSLRKNLLYPFHIP